MTKRPNLSHLTIEELINQLEDIRGMSPILDLLVSRLENSTTRIPDSATHSVKCPVCAAEMTADYDVENEIFTLKV
jgi:hypothetical protein